jgi:hypothetical protein
MITPKATLLVAVAAVSPILGWMALAMINEEPQSSPPSEPTPPRRILVRLLGPADEITGLEVPKGLKNQGDTYLRVEEPVDVTVLLPGDRSIRTRARYVSVNVDHGVVVDAYLLPLPKTVPFRDAVAALRRLMREMSIEPDERMSKQMAAWPEESGDFTCRAEVTLSESATFLVKVRPGDDGGHFLVLTFAADGPARRAVWDPTLKAASKPSADEKGKESDHDSSSK